MSLVDDAFNRTDEAPDKARKRELDEAARKYIAPKHNPTFDRRVERWRDDDDFEEIEGDVLDPSKPDSRSAGGPGSGYYNHEGIEDHHGAVEDGRRRVQQGEDIDKVAEELAAEEIALVYNFEDGE